MRKVLKMALLFSIALMLWGCKEKPKNTSYESNNSIYHWKTTFDIDSAEVAFLEKHKINRIYVRMFDVALRRDVFGDMYEVEPIATTKFLSPIPQNIEVVPVAYITLDALKQIGDRTDEFANLIVARLLAMCNYNKCGEIKELQLDCDWTMSTRSQYCTLCKSVKDLLHKKGIELSVTIRLHQLQEAPPPVDRGVLMLYNTGALKNFNTKNSILDIDDVKPYLKQNKYKLPLAYAYPFFGWGVKFKNEKFLSIVSEKDTLSDQNESIRFERPKSEEIYKVKKLVESHLGKPKDGTILYHLDISQLNNYGDDEVDKILAD